MTSKGSGSSFEVYRLRRDGRGFARNWALSLRRPLAPDFRKQGTRCPIRVAMLAADRGAINRLFCFASCQTGIGKDRFRYSWAILMSRCERGQLRTSARRLDRGGRDDCSGRRDRAQKSAIGTMDKAPHRTRVVALRTMQSDSKVMGTAAVRGSFTLYAAERVLMCIRCPR